jgi:hypothetical protein
MIWCYGMGELLVIVGEVVFRETIVRKKNFGEIIGTPFYHIVN